MAFEFIAFGDIPYDDGVQMLSVGQIGRQARANGYSFAINYGDIKGGGESCADRLIENRLEAIAAVLPGRVVMTPGDNDWTDCDRSSAGGFDELERLDHLIARHKYHAPDDADLGIIRQAPAYWENARWVHEDVLFATLHVVGTDNGRRDIDHSDKDVARERVWARDAANLTWMEQAFATARDIQARALVFAMHHDPTDFKHRDKADKPCTVDRRKKCNPYKALMDRLISLTGASGLPVLLIHGSTKEMCLDKGFGGEAAPTLWRLNGPGDFAVLDAAVVRVNSAAQVPFRASLLLGDIPIPEGGC